MKKKIIAIFGGAFNPPTVAHIDLAKQILEKIEDVEKIIFVPVSTKYNKRGLVSDEARLNMLKKICTQYDRMEVSSIELESKRQLRTIETLTLLQEQNPNNEICFVIGSDNLKELTTWHRAQDLISTFRLMILKRDNDNIKEIIENNEILREYKNSFIELNQIEPIKMSSTDVRERIKENKKIEGLVPEEIQDDAEKMY